MRWLPLLLVVLPGCSLYRSDDTPTWPGDELPACATTRQAYRIDAIDIPSESTQAEALGWDLDGDGTLDNQGGNIISAVDQALTVDLQNAVDEALAGDLVQIGLTVDQCASPDYALVSVVRGVELDRSVEPPRMLGEDVTTLAAVAVDGLPGAATDGVAEFPVGQLIHPFADAWIDTAELVVVVDEVSDDEIAGHLVGGLDGDHAFDIVARGLQAKIVDRENELGPCTPQQCDDTLQTVYRVFDDNGDFIVTLDEIKTNSLFETLLRPDLDFDGDGSPEHLSIGVGFHASRVDLFLRS